MPEIATLTKTANKALVALAGHLPDAYCKDKFDQLCTALALLPMSAVLDKVPGESVLEKTKLLGISRNTWYCWYRGDIRPNKLQAAKLERLTGVKAELFQGRR
jgi:hypothetical protein